MFKKKKKEVVAENNEAVNSEATENTPKAELTEEEKKAAKKSAKLKRRRTGRKIINGLMGFVVFCALLGCVSGISIIKTIISKSDVILEVEDLNSTDSSLIFDSEGNQIMMLGKESRVSFAYNKFPQSLVDAFISVEDSRYFEHNGFDVPRFAKAFLENVRSLSFAQGGSTITMQAIKNTYFAVDTIAETSIDRKVQEIYFSLQINSAVSKEKVLEMYINKINYGANTRGVQVASQYYFGKDCTDLTLVESAMLAGVVNAPNLYNPYWNLEECTQRTHDVLYLMKYHGYITEKEYEVACNVKIENLLYGNKMNTANEVEIEDGTISNQAYIDVVLAELDEMYGIDPYTTPVKVYTAMNQTVQDTCDAISRGEIINFKDANINAAAAVIQNYTGLIVGVCGGRNYDAQRIFNYAYDARISPGSTSKAMFTYPLAFEYCGMSTSYTFTDEPMTWSGTSIQINNDSRVYNGETSIQKTLPLSYNTPSVYLYRWVEKTIGENAMKKYLRTIGYDEDMVANMNEQYSIGCLGYEVSPIQMAAVQSMLLSKGMYTTPHTITKIEFINSDKEPITPNIQAVRALSEGAAWLTTYIQYIGINGGTENDFEYNMRLSAIRRSYPVYGKTGTNGFDIQVIRQWGYPAAAEKDLLYIWGTNDYSFSFWMGYDTGRYQSSSTYMSYAYAHSMQDVYAVNALINATERAFGTPKNQRTQPSDVTRITHMIGKYPYVSLPEYADKKYQTTGYILSQFAKVGEYEEGKEIASLEKFDAKLNADKLSLDLEWSEYPDKDATKVASKTLEMKFYGVTYKGVRRIHNTWIDGPVHYFVEITNDKTGDVVTYDTENPKETVQLPEYNKYENNSFTVKGFYSYTINKEVQSNMIEKKITIEAEIPEFTFSVAVSSNEGAVANHVTVKVDGKQVFNGNINAGSAEHFTVKQNQSYEVTYNQPDGYDTTISSTTGTVTDDMTVYISNTKIVVPEPEPEVPAETPVVTE